MEINCYFSVLFFLNNVADPNKSIIPEVVISRSVLDFKCKKSQKLKSRKNDPLRGMKFSQNITEIHDIHEKSIYFAYLKHPSPPKGNFPLYELIHYHFHDLLFAIFPSKTTTLIYQESWDCQRWIFQCLDCDYCGPCADPQNHIKIF